MEAEHVDALLKVASPRTRGLETTGSLLVRRVQLADLGAQRVRGVADPAVEKREVRGGVQQALVRVLAMQVAREMEQQHLTKTQMARRMHTSRSSLERLLDPENESVTLQTLDKAARSLGRRIAVALV